MTCKVPKINGKSLSSSITVFSAQNTMPNQFELLLSTIILTAAFKDLGDLSIHIRMPYFVSWKSEFMRPQGTGLEPLVSL